MADMTVKTDATMEAIARKLHGINGVPEREQAAMIRRAAKAGADAERAKVKIAGKLADALRTVIYTNALEESDCLAGVEVLKEWNALRECGEGE